MPLETIGSLALAGSSGASTRGARSISGDFSNAAFAASKARGGDTGGNVIDIIEIPSPAPNLAAYLSPFIRFDAQTRLAIVEFRDSQSGQVEQQYPSPRAVREYQQNLPEDSDLRAPDQTEGDVAPPTVVASDESTDVPAALPSFGSGAPDAPVIAPVAPAVAEAATAAFNSLQNALTGGRQLAVA